MAGFLSRVKIQKTILAASIALQFGVGAYAFAQGLNGIVLKTIRARSLWEV